MKSAAEDVPTTFIDDQLRPPPKNEFNLTIFQNVCSFVVDWLDACPETGGFPPHATVLLTGQRRSGKTTLVRQMCSYFSKQPFFVRCDVVDVADFIDRRPDALETRIRQFVVDKIILCRPAIFVLENVDVVFPEGGAESQQNSSALRYQVEEFMWHFSKLAGVLLVATSSTSEATKISPFVKVGINSTILCAIAYRNQQVLLTVRYVCLFF